MRNLIVLLAVAAVVAAAMPAYGISTYSYFKGGSIATGEGDFHTLTDWGLWETDWALETGGWITGVGYIPIAGGSANVRGGGQPGVAQRICHIWDDVDMGGGRFRVGYTQVQMFNCGGHGHYIVEKDPITAYEPVVAADYIRIGLWNWWHDGQGNDVDPCIFEQKAGTVTCDLVDIGRSADGDGPPGSPLDCGYGKYIISGGTLNETYNGIFMGWKFGDVATDAIGKGTLRIEGDAATINSCQLEQNQISKLEVQLNAATGGLTQINVTPKPWHPAEMMNDLRGELELDVNGAAITTGTRIPVIVLDDVYLAPGVDPIRDALLDYSTMTLTAPDGWGLIDDGLGALSVKYRLGDVDESGSVGQVDLDEILQSSRWGQTQVLDDIEARWAADVSCDDFVGQADLDAVLADWGESGAGAVPEPATMVLLGLGGLALIRRKK